VQRTNGWEFYTIIVQRSIESKILRALADEEDVDPGELDIVLYDHIDLEAVADLIDNSSSAWNLSFEILSYVVTVDDEESVVVEPQNRSQAPNLCL
jgi:hypothetical protein